MRRNRWVELARWFGSHDLDGFRPSGTGASRRHNHQALFLNSEFDFIVEPDLIDDRLREPYPSRVSDANQPGLHGNHNVSTLRATVQGAHAPKVLESSPCNPTRLRLPPSHGAHPSGMARHAARCCQLHPAPRSGPMAARKSLSLSERGLQRPGLRKLPRCTAPDACPSCPFAAGICSRVAKVGSTPIAPRSFRRAPSSKNGAPASRAPYAPRFSRRPPPNRARPPPRGVDLPPKTSGAPRSAGITPLLAAAHPQQKSRMPQLRRDRSPRDRSRRAGELESSSWGSKGSTHRTVVRSARGGAWVWRGRYRHPSGIAATALEPWVVASEGSAVPKASERARACAVSGVGAERAESNPGMYAGRSATQPKA